MSILVLLAFRRLFVVIRYKALGEELAAGGRLDRIQIVFAHCEYHRYRNALNLMGNYSKMIN